MGIVRAATQPTSPGPRASVKSRRGRALLVALGIPAMVAIATQAAVADTKKASASAPRTQRVSARPAAQKAGASPSADGGAPAAPSALVSSESSAAASDAGVIESKTLDGGTRVFKFSELDIEGRLKSPQLVYFLRRVRAEFAAGDLGHRTFMREMSETRKEPSF
jgi:hypothetical protein